MDTPAKLIRHPAAPYALAAGLALAGCAWLTRRFARKAEAANPPRGQFVTVAGTRLHYTEHGDPAHPPLVLLHGCGSMGRELELSGLVEEAAREFRVIVIDRPGYGYSERPAGHSHTPHAQAELIVRALRVLGVRRPLLLGHSWGTLVALAAGLQHPGYLRGLVLVSGYYTPSLRLDTLWLGLPAVPVVGGLLRHTVSPLLGRLLWPLMLRRVFAPAAVTERFAREYPVWMSLRPGQLKAAAAEAAMLQVQAARLRARIGELQVPMVLVAGEKDRFVMTSWQSGRLAKQLANVPLQLVAGAGHMVHHTATGAVMKSVREAFQASLTPEPTRSTGAAPSPAGGHSTTPRPELA